ncbi:MAG: hypothetical protein ACAH59_07120 [Pseudobdellovibrionaceae bacterium]
MKNLILFVGIFFANLALATDWNISCAKWGDDFEGGYCIHKPVNSTNQDVIYHFHGARGTEAFWQEKYYYPSQIRQYWDDNQLQAPTVISISFGPFWLLAEKNSSEVSGLFEIFVNEIVPKIENSIGGVRGRRIVVGESMGGFNATQMALKTKLFQKAAFLCAPMVDKVSPYSSPAEIDAFIRASSAWQYYTAINDQQEVVGSVNSLLQISKIFYPKPEDWAKANPLNLIRGLKSATELPPIYQTVGFYDPYAIYEGNEVFAKLLTRLSGQLEWHPTWGGHCAFDIPSLSKFLVE